MKLHYLHIVFFLLFLSINTIAQDIPKQYFCSPLKIKHALSGNFGEPRFAHFHSGLDFRTYADNKPIIAIADAYIYRILVSPWGYGHCLYLKHNNDYISVYAHLNEFRSDIQSFIRKIQYEKKSFTIDTILNDSTFIVKQNQIIGYSGNTGSSEGPHLHFEIREAKTNKSINTLQSLYAIEDNVKPVASHIIIYPASSETLIDGKNEKTIYTLNQNNDGYYLNKTPKVYGKIGIGIAYVDKMNNSNNRFGAKLVELFIDNLIYYKSEMIYVDFNKQKNKNSMFDFQLLKDKSLHVHKLFVEPNNDLDYFETGETKGYLLANQQNKYAIKINISDYNNNTASIKFNIETSKPTNKFISTNNNKLLWDKSYLFVYKDFRLEIDSASLFDNSNFYIQSRSNSSYLVGDTNQSLKQDIKLSFYINELSIHQKDKLCIVRKLNNKIKYLHTRVEQNYVIANSSFFGEFFVLTDTISPKISVLNYGKIIKSENRPYIGFKIEDNLSGIKSYNLYINDTWVLAQYEPNKNNRLVYYIDSHFNYNSKNKIYLVVSDNHNNISEYQYEL